MAFKTNTITCALVIKRYALISSKLLIAPIQKWDAENAEKNQ